MGLRITGILFDELTADPGTPIEGQVWYNTTAQRLRVRRNGVTQDLIDSVDLSTHVAASNPHAVTLELARTAGATLAGAFSMGSNKITSLAAPTVAGDAAEFQWVIDQINSKLNGHDWQESVIDKDLATPPGSPATGDRYIVATGGTGAWVGKDGQIAEWDGSAWVFAIPNEGFTTRVMDENLLYIHDGTAWGPLAATIDHGALIGLADDDHTQYLLINGTRAMSGDLDMGANDIVNVGLVDGVNLPAHAARHEVGGADEVAHGNQAGGTLHALASASGAGFQPQSNLVAVTDPGVSDDNTGGYVVGSRWANVSTDEEFVCLDASTGAAVWKSTTTSAGGGFLAHKAGRVLAASFAGSPKKATVTFSTAFADANYAVALTALTTNDTEYEPSVESQVAGSFVINLGSNSTSDLTHMGWIAVKDGES